MVFYYIKILEQKNSNITISENIFLYDLLFIITVYVANTLTIKNVINPKVIMLRSLLFNSFHQSCPYASSFKKPK